MTTRERINEVEIYIGQLTPDGFGLSIGADFRILDIVFETLSPEEVISIKQDLSVNFPDAVYFN
jgi:hypothetical protein